MHVDCYASVSSTVLVDIDFDKDSLTYMKCKHLRVYFLISEIIYVNNEFFFEVTYTEENTNK